MAVKLPEEAFYSILTDKHLASKYTYKDLDINTGEDISCLGFPYSTPSDEAYFPILRSGKYASYNAMNFPDIRDFLLDFRIYPGNSGGPVFADLKIRTGSKGGIFFTPSALLGVVSQQVKSIDKNYSLDLAKVISSEKVYELIYRLPYPGDIYLKERRK